MAFKIDIIGDIEGYWGVGFDRIQRQLDNANNEDIEVRLHSGGGSVLEGFAIRNALKSHKGKVTINIIGLAASIASLILTGADEITIQKGAFVMVHNVKLWPNEPLTTEELTNQGKTVQLLENEIIEAYVDLAKQNGKLIDGKEAKTRTNFKKLVNAETWLNAEQAVEIGLATKVVEVVGAQGNIMGNRFTNTLSNYKNTPKQIKNLYMEKEEEKISVGAIQAIFNSITNLFKNKEATEEQQINQEGEETPIIKQTQKESMTIEEMQKALENEGFNVAKAEIEDKNNNPKDDKLATLEASLKEMQATLKGFEAKLATPTGGERPAESKETKISPLQAAINAQLKTDK